MATLKQVCHHIRSKNAAHEHASLFTARAIETIDARV
jgi:hypothetical protein